MSFAYSVFSDVSIPCGTIKSHLSIYIGVCSFWFQFLVVQLRAPPTLNMSKLCVFQFLVVQLREESKCMD